MIDFIFISLLPFWNKHVHAQSEAGVRWVIDPWYQLTPTLSAMLSASHTPAQADRRVTDTALKQLLLMLGRNGCKSALLN